MSDNKRSILEQIEALQSQAKTVMNDTVVPIDERIQKAADIYRQAESMAEDCHLDDRYLESLSFDSATFFKDYGLIKEAFAAECMTCSSSMNQRIKPGT